MDIPTGLLLTTFVIAEMLAAPVFGYIGDKGISRKYLLMAGVLVWSAATCASSLCNTFWSLLIPRTIVGIGEAVYTSVSPALIADYFPKHQVSKALTAYYVVIPVGVALGYAIGGFVGQNFGWRMAFLVSGVPGLFFALCVAALKEPPRGQFDVVDTEGASSIVEDVTGEADNTESPKSGEAGKRDTSVGLVSQSSKSTTPPVIEGLKILFRNRAWVFATCGYIAVTFGMGALSDWLPTFFSRYYDATIAEADVVVGAIVMVGGLAGTIVGGVLADIVRKSFEQPYFAVSTVSQGFALSLGFLALVITLPKLVVELLFFFIVFFSWFFNGPINAIITNCVSANMRGRSNAVGILFIHAFGDAASPAIVGAISDSTGNLRLAIAIVPAVMCLSVAFWACGWAFVKQDTAGGGLSKAFQEVELEDKKGVGRSHDV
ncbi:MFS transporter [Pelomyxa schiedti]|nr:MFS transporter [Pelomyxa schiedti]